MCDIIIGNGAGYLSSNLRWGCSYFPSHWFLSLVSMGLCDNIPNTASPHYLNFLYQLMAIRSSCSSSHLRPRAFHMFYKYTTDTTYITKSGRKKNKQERTWVSPKHKKREGFGTFLAFCGNRECIPKLNSHTATWNADSFSHTGCPGSWVHKSQLLSSAAASLWPSPFPDCR